AEAEVFWRLIVTARIAASAQLPCGRITMLKASDPPAKRLLASSRKAQISCPHRWLPGMLGDRNQASSPHWAVSGRVCRYRLGGALSVCLRNCWLVEQETWGASSRG